MSVVFPKANHNLCYNHLSKKLQSFGQIIVGLFQRDVYTYDSTEYNTRMEQICTMRPEAYKKMMDIEPGK